MGGATNGAGGATGGTASGGSRPTSGGLGGDIVVHVGSGGAGGGSGGNAEGWLDLCELDGTMSVGSPNGSLIIDDFDDEVTGFFGNGLWGGFYGYTDGTGFQTPTGEDLDASRESGGPSGSGSALRIQGGGQTDYGSGFGAVFASLGIGDECLFDASAYSGVTFWAKGHITPNALGSGARPGLLRVKVGEKDVVPFTAGGNCPDSAPCYDFHGENVALTDCWQLYSISFSDLKPEGWGVSGGDLDRSELYVLEFGLGEYTDYEIWIDELRFFVGSEPSSEPVCENGMGGMGGIPL